VFSKSFPQLGWTELAKAAKGAGFDGIDLTVRSDGHVLPERAAVDLPKAIAAIRAEGMVVPMLTTELVDLQSTGARPILEIAGKLSVPYIKPGYYPYKSANPFDDVREAGRRFRGLVDLAKENGVQIGYHNHPDWVGGSIWDAANVIEPLDAHWSGYYFDLGHSSVNEGEDEWRIAANLVMPRLKMVAVKDMTWTAGGERRWQPVSCPMGTGMAPWKEFFALLAKSSFNGPISFGQAYAIPGVADEEGIAVSRAAAPKVMAAAGSNLEYLKARLREAYGHA
jgi:sugar phosphate isomerase/epimerase